MILLLGVICTSCGGSSSTTQGTPEPPEPALEPVEEPPVEEPPAEALFTLSFPPAISLTEDETIVVVGSIAEGIDASGVSARAGGQETALQPQPNGEWRGELPLNEGENALNITVSPTGGSPQTSELAVVRRSLLLTFPRGLVVIGDLGYTIDAGLVEIDLRTGSGRRLGADVGVGANAQLVGQTGGRLLVREEDLLFFVDVVTGVSEPLLPASGSSEGRPRLDSAAVDQETNTLFATTLSSTSPPFISSIVTVDLAVSTAARQITFGAEIGELGARSFLGFDARTRSLVFQTFVTSEQPEATLLSINVDTGESTERRLTFEDESLMITAAIEFLDGLIAVDSLGRVFRIEDETVTPVRFLSGPNELVGITALGLNNDQLIALDRSRGSLLRVDPNSGETEVLVSAAAGRGPRAAGWHGLASNASEDRLLGLSFLGLQSIDTKDGARSDSAFVEFTPVSAGPNFIALPPLARALTLDVENNSLWFALVSNVPIASNDFVRMDLATGLVETLGSATTSAPGLLLSDFPSVAIDPTAQLGWFFDVDSERSFTRIDLVTGATSEFPLSVADRAPLSVLADPANERLLFATTEPVIPQGNRLEVIAIDYEGGSPELLATVLVGVDAVSVTNPAIQMALSLDSNTLFVPLPDTQRIAVVDLVAGSGQVIGQPVLDDGLNRFSTGISIAVASENRLFFANGEDGLNAIDSDTGARVLLSR